MNGMQEEVEQQEYEIIENVETDEFDYLAQDTTENRATNE